MSNSPLSRHLLTAGLLLSAAGGAGVLVAVSPAVGLAAVLGPVILFLAAGLDPKRLAVLGLITVLLSRSVEIASGWAPSTYLDEVVTGYLAVVIIGGRLMRGRPLRRPPGIVLFSLFAVFGLLSCIVSSVPLGIAAAGGILAVKGILFYFTLAQVDWTAEDVPWLARTAAWVVGVALLCGLVNLLIPGPWTAVLANTGQPQYRSFIPSLIGPFTHPLQFGNFMSLAAIAGATPLLYWARTRTGARGAWMLFIASVVSAALSFRRTAIVGMLAGLSLLVLRRRNAGLLVTALLLLPIAGIVLYPVIHEVAIATYDSYVLQGGENARTRMTVDSVVLAVQHFPFGVGFGRFGSATAASNYSVEYMKLGYDAIQGLGGPDNPHNHGRWLTDTQWPSIVGEAGLVGAVCFVGGLLSIFSTFRKAARNAHLPLRLLGLTGVGWSVHILLQSVAYPVFVIAPTAPLLFGLAAITYVILTRSGAEPAAEEARLPRLPTGGDLVRPALGGAISARRRPVPRTSGTDDGDTDGSTNGGRQGSGGEPRGSRPAAAEARARVRRG
jgi:hypothetical protein